MFLPWFTTKGNGGSLILFRTMISGGIIRSSQKAIPMNPSPSCHFTFKSLSLILVTLAGILLLPAHALCAQITIDSDEQFRFAEQTMEKGDYLRAVFEFERFLQFFPEDKKVPKARLLTAQCYMKAKDYESARKGLNEVLKDYEGTLVAGKALFLMGESYFQQGLYDEAER